MEQDKKEIEFINGESMEKLNQDAQKDEGKNKVLQSQRNEEKNQEGIIEEEDYSKEDLCRDNGINGHDKDPCGPKMEGTKSYFQAITHKENTKNVSEKMIRLRFNFIPERTCTNASSMPTANRMLLGRLAKCVTIVERKARIETWKGTGGRGIDKESIETMDKTAIKGHIDFSSTNDNTAAATGLLKDDVVYPNEENEDKYYAYGEECEEDYNPENVDVYQLFQNDVGTTCSPTEFIHSSGINRGADVIPVANRNAFLQYNDDTCVRHADVTLYNFDMISGATYKIPPAINANRCIIDYVDSCFEFYECNSF